MKIISIELNTDSRRVKMAGLIYLIEATGELLATLTIKLFDIQVRMLP